MCRRCRSVTRRSTVRRSRAAGTTGFRCHRGEFGDGGGDLPPPRRDAAGDRAGGGARAGAVAGRHPRQPPRPFRLLTGGARTAVRRQQTLRASVDWSHALLTEPERVLFRRLAVFLGGFDLDAAQAVAGTSDVERYQVLDQLSLLVDKSLVIAENTTGRTRYRLLETVRQYALEKLGESGEADDVRTPPPRPLSSTVAAVLDASGAAGLPGAPPSGRQRYRQPAGGVRVEPGSGRQRDMHCDWRRHCSRCGRTAAAMGRVWRGWKRHSDGQITANRVDAAVLRTRDLRTRSCWLRGRCMDRSTRGIQTEPLRSRATRRPGAVIRALIARRRQHVLRRRRWQARASSKRPNWPKGWMTRGYGARSMSRRPAPALACRRPARGRAGRRQGDCEVADGDREPRHDAGTVTGLKGGHGHTRATFTVRSVNSARRLTRQPPRTTGCCSCTGFWCRVSPEPHLGDSRRRTSLRRRLETPRPT